MRPPVDFVLPTRVPYHLQIYTVTCMSDYKWAFGLVIGFIAHFCTQLVTTGNYSAAANSHSANSLQHTLKSSQPAVFTSFLVTASNGGRSPSSGFPNYPLDQLPASDSNGSQGLNGSGPVTHAPTHQLTHSTLLVIRLTTISHQPLTLLTAISRLASNGSWPSLYSLATDRTENIVYNSSSIVACVCCGHYLATAVDYIAIT
jgi:hypothetical protein